MNRADLQVLSVMRVEEARTLLAAGHFSGSYYLAGYAVECALKACIAKRTHQYEFPDKDRVLESYVHKPAKLLKAADLEGEFQATSDSALRASWNFVLIWTEASRYTVATRQDAEQMLQAVTAKAGGVLPWIQQRW